MQICPATTLPLMIEFPQWQMAEWAVKDAADPPGLCLSLKRSGSRSQSLLRSHWLLLHWNNLIDHILWLFHNWWPYRWGPGRFTVLQESDIEKHSLCSLSAYYRNKGAIYGTKIYIHWFCWTLLVSECLGSLYTHHDNTFNIHVTFRKRKTAKQDNKICYLNNNNF